MSTALDESQAGSGFKDAQFEEANAALKAISPQKIYPFRFTRWQGGGLLANAVAIAALWVSQSPLGHGPKSAAERADLKEMGAKVERIAKPLVAKSEVLMVPPSQKKVAGDMEAFARDLQEGRLNKEEALRKGNELAERAEKESKSRAEEAVKKAEEAETSLGKYEKLKLEQSGIDSSEFEKTNLNASEQAALDRMIQDAGFQSPKSEFSSQELKEMGANETAEKLSQLTPQQREQLRQAVAQMQKQLQDEQNRIDALPEAERKKLEKQRAELQKQMQEAQKLADALKLSDEAAQAIRDLMNSEEMKKIREQLAKMQHQAGEMAQGRAPTKEDIEQLKKQLEELAKQLKDPKAREELMKKLQEMAKQLEQGQMSSESMQMMLNAMGSQAGQQNPDGNPGTSQDDQFSDTGKVVKSDKEMETKGKAKPKGQQWSVTVKAPTQVGNRSSVPYQSIAPKYSREAEKALNSGKIPRDKERRVKEYFDSLNGKRRP
jgi:hypothetical protein